MFAEETTGGQRLAASLGISARGLGFARALLSALLRVALVAMAFALIIGPWEVSTADLFDTIVDGHIAEQRHLRGKPAPDTFLEAAKELGVAPGDAAVFEDALAGVEAGRAGGFGAVVGVDRVGQAAELAAHGAGIVVSDLDELLET